MLLKHIMCDSLILIKGAAHNVFVVISRMSELDYFVHLHVQMVLVHSILFNLDFGILQIANVTSGCTGMFLQEVAKVLQLVIHVVGLFQVCEKGLLAFFYLLCNQCRLLFGSFHFFLSLLVLHTLHCYYL